MLLQPPSVYTMHGQKRTTDPVDDGGQVSEMLERTVSTPDGGTITYTRPKNRVPGHGVKTGQLLADNGIEPIR